MYDCLMFGSIPTLVDGVVRDQLLEVVRAEDQRP